MFATVLGVIPESEARDYVLQRCAPLPQQRSVLADAIGMFRYLKVGLSIVLIFIGVKMLIDPHGKTPEWYQFKIPTTLSLVVIAGIIVGSILISVAAAKKEGKLPPDDQKPGVQPSPETDEATGKDKNGPKS